MLIDRLLIATTLALVAGRDLAAQITLTRPAVRRTPYEVGQPLRLTMSRGTVEVTGSPTATAVTWEILTRRGDSAVVLEPGPWARMLTYDNTLRLDVVPPADAGVGPLTVRVTVPRTLKMVQIRLSAGNVTVRDVDGDVTVENDSGAVVGTRLGGGVVVETLDGGITVEMSTRSPRHAVSLLARNGPISLSVPGPAGNAPSAMTLGCDLVHPNGFPRTDRAREKQVLESLGIAQRVSGCDTMKEPIDGGVRTVVGQQMLDASWIDGGAPISLRTLRGGITVRSR